jgi:hypothetical protein
MVDKKTLDERVQMVGYRPYKSKTGQAFYVAAIVNNQPVTYYTKEIDKDVLSEFVDKDGDGVNWQLPDGGVLVVIVKQSIGVFKGGQFIVNEIVSV